MNFYEDDLFQSPENDDFCKWAYMEIDGRLGQDELFDRLTKIINKVASEGKRILNMKKAEIKDNSLIRDLFFFLCIFSLKMGLYIALRKGSENGYCTNSEEDFYV